MYVANDHLFSFEMRWALWGYSMCCSTTSYCMLLLFSYLFIIYFIGRVIKAGTGIPWLSSKKRCTFEIYSSSKVGRTRRRGVDYKMPFKTPAFRFIFLFLPVVEPAEKGATVKANHLLAYAQKLIIVREIRRS